MLRTDKRFYPQTPEDLLEKASEIAKRADDGLPALFGTLPRLPYGVRPVPAEIGRGLHDRPVLAAAAWRSARRAATW